MDGPVWVIMRSTGEYSDRSEEPIRFCLSEAEAMRAVETADAEKQARADERPNWPPREETYGMKMPDGSWLPESVRLLDAPGGARFTPLPDHAEREARNAAREKEYRQSLLDMGCVDPAGPSPEATYSIAHVTLWRPSAIATEAGTAETENTGSVHEGAGR